MSDCKCDIEPLHLQLGTCFLVWGVFHLNFALCMPLQWVMWLILDTFTSLETHCYHFPTWRANFFLKLRFGFFWHFSVLHLGFKLLLKSYMALHALANKQKSVQDPKTTHLVIPYNSTVYETGLARTQGGTPICQWISSACQ